jgi:glycosyltransferase involved in cell wall biosynthesis
MRILICNWKDLAHPAAGGAEVYTHECARRWAKWGHTVTQLSASVAGRPAVEVSDGVRIVRSGSRLGVYGAARRFLRSHAGLFDVIVDEINTRPFFAHHHAGGTPVVALVHQVAREVWAHETPRPVSLLGRYVLEPRWLPEYAHVPVLTVSESSADSLASYGMRNLQIVPMGVEIDPAVAPHPPTGAGGAKAVAPTLVFCGRLVSMKRPSDAIAAFTAARPALGPDARLEVIGTGPLEASLRAEAPDGVAFLGRLSERDKYAHLARAHALLVTSVREGWGLVVSEAAAVGTPSIAYDVAGLRDSVRAGRGVLVPEDPGSLAEAVRYWVPRFRARPPAPLPHGGAHDWDTVASAVLDALIAQVHDRRMPAAA